MKKFSYLKYEKFHLQIFSTIVHKNNLFLDMNVHYLSKKQPRTYFLSNLCKILDIFANDIFHISYMKFFSYFEIERILPFCFLYDRKTSFGSKMMSKRDFSIMKNKMAKFFRFRNMKNFIPKYV